MGIFKKTGKVVSHIVDFRVDRWVDLEYLKRSTLYYWRQVKFICTIKKPKYDESFDEAVDRLALNSDTLNKQMTQYKYLFMFFFSVAMMLFAYAVYIGNNGNWMGTCLSAAIAMYALSLAFHFHFWRFQITHQKLGCSLQEWFNSIIQFKRDTKV